MAESATGGSWWGGWLQAAKEKSTSALDFMKKDLVEFSNVMQKDTAVAAGAVKDKINHETATEATRKVKDGATTFLRGISKALVIEPEDKHYRGVPITVGSHIYDKAKARLHAIQLDPGTYCSEPPGPPEEFTVWLGTFVLDEQKGSISELLVSNVQVRSLYTQLVPSEVSHAHFWQRYFYKVHQLDQDEARKAALKRRADAGAVEAELGWDDDEWGELDTGAPSATNTTSTTTTTDRTQACDDRTNITTNTSDATPKHSEPQSKLDTPCSNSDSLETKQVETSITRPTQEDYISSSPVAVTKDTETTPTVDDSEPVNTTAQTRDRTLTEGDQSVGSVTEVVTVYEQEMALVDDECDQKMKTKNQSDEHQVKEDAEVTQVVHTRDKGDMVLVGADRNTPSSDSSQSKELSSVDDDWEKDFDIEVSEEDIRLAQEAARKLADEGTSPADDEDDDWENWD